MARRIALFALLLSGCLRPVWTEPPHTTTPVVAATEATPPAHHERELYHSRYDDEDRYQIRFDDQIASSADIYLFVSVGEYYPMDCRWRGTTCTSYLPHAARGARVMLIRDKYRRCPTFRLMREDVTLEITEPFIFGCGFVLEHPP